jgi:hypothetical protein
MATDDGTGHPLEIPPEITLHICPACRKDVASGLDAKGFPARCRACSRPRVRARLKSTKPAVERVKELEDQLLAVSCALDLCLCPVCRRAITPGLTAKGNPIKCRTCSQKASAVRRQP